MPIEVKKYRCAHGCKRTLANKSAIAKHEETCWNNVESKSCKTCAFGKIDNHVTGIVWVCSHEDGKKLLAASKIEGLERSEKPISNCPYHLINTHLSPTN